MAVIESNNINSKLRKIFCKNTIPKATSNIFSLGLGLSIRKVAGLISSR